MICGSAVLLMTLSSETFTPLLSAQDVQPLQLLTVQVKAHYFSFVCQTEMHQYSTVSRNSHAKRNLMKTLLPYKYVLSTKFTLLTSSNVISICGVEIISL